MAVSFPTISGKVSQLDKLLGLGRDEDGFA
jgi:hypothetical protein